MTLLLARPTWWSLVMSGPDPPVPGVVLRARRKKQGLTQLDLEAETGVSQATISEIERGEQELTTVGIGRVSALAEALEWTLADLELATGLNLNTGAVPAELSFHGQARPHGTVTLSDPPDKNGAPADQAEPGVIRGAFDAATARRLNAVVLPVRALAAAGKPIDANDILDEEAIAVEDYRPGLQLYRAEGDSMSTTDPDTSITDGDTVWVDTHDRSLRAGKVYVIAIPGGGSTIKRVRLVRGEPWLFSDNPDHEPFPVEPEFVVVGRVTDSFTRKKH